MSNLRQYRLHVYCGTDYLDIQDKTYMTLNLAKYALERMAKEFHGSTVEFYTYSKIEAVYVPTITGDGKFIQNDMENDQKKI